MVDVVASDNRHTYVTQNHFQHLGHGWVLASQELHQLHTAKKPILFYLFYLFNKC